MSQENNEKAIQIEARLSWGSLDNVPTVYANQLYVGFTGTEFYLVFGEVVLPLVLNPENFPKELTVKPSVRLVVPHDSMLGFAKAINQNVGKYLATQDEQNEEEEDS